jgi:hypothetical protein
MKITDAARQSHTCDNLQTGREARSSRFHWQCRLTDTSPDGHHIIMYGIRVGYWPCLHAPFLQIALGIHILECWYGLPSYKEGGLR